MDIIRTHCSILVGYITKYTLAMLTALRYYMDKVCYIYLIEAEPSDN